MTQTVREALDTAVATLERAGHRRDSARIDVDVLTRHVLGWDRATLLVRGTDPMPNDARAQLNALVDRRAAREPVAYLTGVREFYGRPFLVSPAVLIPRPETELIVETVLRRTPPDVDLRVADLGTGSGILAVSIAAERRAVRVDATDISAEALDVAGRNARTHGVTDRVTFHHADLFGALRGPYGIVVANPPYVARRDARGLSPDVGLYEPAVALFGGHDGLDIIPRLLVDAAERLTPDGWVAMEFGLGQEYDVTRHAAAAGLTVEDVVHDLQGIARVLVCRHARVT